jgi:hypothetical protein
MTLCIRRHIHHANICDIWLIKPIGGGARTCLMHGTVSEDDAKLLAEKVRRDVGRFRLTKFIA